MSKKKSDARKFFKEACDLWNTKIFRRAFFSPAFLKSHATGKKNSRKWNRMIIPELPAA